MQAAGAASLNEGPSDVELAKPFDGQQVVQDDREPAGHEASARCPALPLTLHPPRMVLAGSPISEQAFGTKNDDGGGCVGCRVGAGKGLVAPLVHLLVSGGPSDQARAARALSNMATESTVKEQIVAAGILFDILPLSTCCSHFHHAVLHGPLCPVVCETV